MAPHQHASDAALPETAGETKYLISRKKILVPAKKRGKINITARDGIVR
jgi:hypothetical protein